MKPFYIESDEEVTSVIDRLRSSTQDENIFVVPSGAILLQSAVNMRLLQQEAQKQEKSISIVTSDEHGQRLIEKVGIPVYGSLDEIEHLELESGHDDQLSSAQQIGTTQYFDTSSQDVHISETSSPSDTPIHQSQHIRSEALETPSPQNDTDIISSQSHISSSQQNLQQAPQSTQLRTGSAMSVRPSHNIVNLKAPQDLVSTQEPSHSSVDYSQQIAQNDTLQEQSKKYHSHLDAHTEKEVQAFFGHKEKQQSPYRDSSITPYAHVPDKMSIKHSISKWVWIFGSVIMLLAFGVAFFVFLPQVKVDLIPIFDQKDATVEIVADGAQGDVDYDGKKIPLTMIEAQLEDTVVASATGTSSAGSFKARGIITVYNSFSKQSQPLVATTRFLTDDGKLFRLVKRVIVPGMHEVNGQIQPGEIDAEVVADKAGEEFNIEPSTFSIPGFKGSAKYKKFYGKSKLVMMGGSSEGGTKKVASEEDLANAKKSAEEKVRMKIMEKLRNEASAQNKKLLDDAVEVIIISSGTPVTAGVVAASFDYTVNVKARGLIFDESVVKTIIARDMQGNNIQEDATKRFAQNVTVQYSPSLADFDKQTLAIRATGAVQLRQDIDIDGVRDKLAGASGDEINNVLQEFSGIQSADIYYQPGFLTGRFPWWENAITVNVKE